MRYSLRVFLLLLVTTIALTSCKEDSQPNKPAQLTINYAAVILNHNSEPISGAIVNIMTIDGSKIIATDTSDANGNISFEEINVENDDLKLLITHDEYNSLSLKYEEWCKEKINKIYLDDKSDCCGIAELKVTDTNGNPLKRVLVQVRQDMKELQKSETDESGIVRFDSLCLEKYEFRLSLDGYKVIEKVVKIENCRDTTQLGFMMTKKEMEDDCCKGVLKIKSKDKDGNILNGTKVYIYKEDKLIEDPTIKEGQVIVDGLCKGKYTVVLKKDGYKDKVVHIELGCNEEKTIEATLEKMDTDCCKGAVIITVKDKGENLLNNITVRIWKGSEKLEEQKTKDGKAIFGGLCEGDDYSISIFSEDYQGMEFEFDLGCNEELSYEKTLATKDNCCDAILKFIVMDKEGKTAIEGAKITLKLDGKVIVEKQLTNGDGYFIAKELCKGKYLVIIEKDGYKTIEAYWKIEKCDDYQEHFWME